MAIRFVIGRAGTGKTHHCLEAVRARLREDPIEGPRLISLVPEQASLQIERAILQPADIPGAHRAEVLSFERLAYRVLDSVGAPPRRALSEEARAMVLRHLIRDRSKQLLYYRRAERMGGCIDRLSATIGELIQEAVDPPDLEAIAEQTEDENPAQRAKLHDLHLIYAAYLDYLGDQRLDPSQHLQAAREHLSRCAWLTGAQMWVDGFASLSGQELLTLIGVARLCQHVDITMLLDPSLRMPTATSGSPAGLARLFRKTHDTYQRLCRALRDAGLVVEEPLILSPGCPPRFRHNSSLEQMERSLFSVTEDFASAAENAPTALELVELPSRRIEVDYAVSRICRWVQDSTPPYRYRNIAVIVRDLKPYHDLLSEALTARGIPFFIDHRRSTAHHPLVELLRGVVNMATQGLSLESVRLVLKTGLVPIDVDDLDELENYLLAHGPFGLDVWRGDDWTAGSRGAFGEADDEPSEWETKKLTRINATRRAFLALVDPWLGFAVAGQAYPGPKWTEAISDWLERLEVGNTLESLAGGAQEDGDVDQAAEHRQVWRDAMSFLEDLAYAFTDLRLTADELAEVLEQGLSNLTLGLAPPMIDQVLVGSIERSRHPDIQAAIILGFNDGVFPARPGEDAILNDDDRTLLTRCGVGVAPPVRERVLDEALLIYVAMTRASDALVVTYATADNDGKALAPSPYVGAIQAACPTLELNRIGDPARLRETWDILSSGDLAKRVLMEFRTRGVIGLDDKMVRGRWNALYDGVRLSLARDSALRWAMTSLGGRLDARMSPASVKRLIPQSLHTSVSRLETYATCPFKYFANYGLKLGERAEAALAPVDVGRVHHAILEDVVRTLSQRKEGFAQLSEAELLGNLHESCGRIATRLGPEGVMSDARNAYLLRRSASYLARILRSQRRASQVGTTRPRAAELPFGFDPPPGLPAIELTTPAGNRVLLRGYIDRVDLAELGDELLGIVIDYKRTRDKRLKLDEVYHGLSLQLIAYLLVLAEHGVALTGRPIRPVAGLYVSLAPKYEQVDHPENVNPREAQGAGTFRPRGLVRADAASALDNALESGWSGAYSIYRKKDGELGHIDDSDAAGGRSFDALLAHTRTKLGELADGILRGDIAVSPYRLGTFSPCSWCPMGSVCRFEMGISDVRFLQTLKRSEVFQRLENITS